MAQNDSLNEVQPIDGYVQDLLRTAQATYGLDIDLDRPTRGQRLEAALAMQDEAHGFYSMEIMVGRRVDSSEPLAGTFAMLKMLDSTSDVRGFYSGFAHHYWPNDDRAR